MRLAEENDCTFPSYRLLPSTTRLWQSPQVVPARPGLGLLGNALPISHATRRLYRSAGIHFPACSASFRREPLSGDPDLMHSHWFAA